MLKEEWSLTNYNVDFAHSEISFQVKHMMVAKVKGHFEAYQATVEAPNLEDLTGANITFDFEVTSIYTKNKDRDDHLRSADFFDAKQYPKISFQSTSITGTAPSFQVTGDLTIRDVTKPVTFNVTFNGKGTNPWGSEVYGFEGDTVIKREDFGLTWNSALETGGVLVGSDVKIAIDLELSPA